MRNSREAAKPRRKEQGDSSSSPSVSSCLRLPKLRFSEFRNGPKWKEQRVKDVCEVNPPIVELPKTFFYIDLEAVESGHLKAKTLVNKDEAPSRAQRLLEVGDVIFQIVRPYQRNNLFFNLRDSHPFVASTGYAQLRANESEGFLYHAIHTDHFVSRVMAQCTGSSYPAINSSDLAEIPLATPPPAEQQKIADCLSTLDELIGAESQKLDALKAHKKGLMQQLFPREGETLPRLRFPEFHSAPEWEEYGFYDLLEGVLDFRGRTPSKLGMEWGGGTIVSLSANNVKNGFIDFQAECNLASEELYEKWMGKVNLEKGDIVFTMEAPLGNALLVPDEEMYILSQRVVAFKTKPIVLNSFLIQVIWSSGFQDAVARLATGSTAKGINQKSLQKVLVRLPSPAEQHRIATCLSSLDDLIAAQSDRLAALQTHKQGLLQQLFPSPAEAAT